MIVSGNYMPAKVGTLSDLTNFHLTEFCPGRCGFTTGKAPVPSDGNFTSGMARVRISGWLPHVPV